MQQAVIHVRQTKVQLKLYRAFKKYAKEKKLSFLDQYSKLSPVNNHPGCLLHRGLKRSKPICFRSMVRSENESNHPKDKEKEVKLECELSLNNEKLSPAEDQQMNRSATKNVIILDDSDDDEEEENFLNIPRKKVGEEQMTMNDDKTSRGIRVEKALKETPTMSSDDENEMWWDSVLEKNPQMANIQNGIKIVLLLQIMAHADYIGDKVVVFSQCLKTLDFIETVLQSSDWSLHVQSIASLSPGRVWGNWRKNAEYLRIDGSISAKERGTLVDHFNENKNGGCHTEKNIEENAKAFLISAKAGNVGINLVAANRVILFDSHWNPAMDLQAIYRCYRYGQSKPVYVYRFLTEGTMEEKVYSRSVNKSSLAARVIDQKDPQRAFTAKELEDIMAFDNWVQCDSCEKWRMLPPHVDPEDLPEAWFCHMNHNDKIRSQCSAKERDAKFYSNFFAQQLANSTNGGHVMEQKVSLKESVEIKPQDDIEKIKFTKRDEILRRLIIASSANHEKSKQSKSKALISKYYFHESLTKSTSTFLDNSSGQT